MNNLELTDEELRALSLALSDAYEKWKYRLGICQPIARPEVEKRVQNLYNIIDKIAVISYHKRMGGKNDDNN